MPSFNFAGRKVFYEVDGAGQPLVILNGIMMSTLSWTPFVGELSRHFKLIRVDFFDQGQSEKLVGMQYDQQLQVELVHALIHHLQLDVVDMVGISYGGEVALLFAATYPKEVHRLMIFNSTAYTSKWLKDIGRGWIASGKTRDGAHYYQTTIPVIYSPEFYETYHEWMQKREAVLIPIFSSPEFLDRMERLVLSAESYDIRGICDQITQPVLLVSAEEDALTPVHDQEDLSKRLPQATWIKIPRSGHASMYEQPLLFAVLVTGFFSLETMTYPI
jgi:pimeloyl-ACP methyl ester carboxylesterase